MREWSLTVIVPPLSALFPDPPRQKRCYERPLCWTVPENKGRKGRNSVSIFKEGEASRNRVRAAAGRDKGTPGDLAG
jgi:hypothetical protein